MRHPFEHSARSHQQGAVLYIALILLMILTIIGVAASRLQTGEAVMARNDHNHQLALQAAEAALRDAEVNLVLQPPPLSAFKANAGGLYVLSEEAQSATPGSIADTIQWNANYPGANPAAQKYTGPTLTGAPASPVVTQVIIESLPPEGGYHGGPLCTPSSQTTQCTVFRITAHAVGGDSSASATVQSILH